MANPSLQRPAQEILSSYGISPRAGHCVIFQPGQVAGILAGQQVSTHRRVGQSARLWDIASGQLLQVFAGHTGA